MIRGVQSIAKRTAITHNIWSDEFGETSGLSFDHINCADIKHLYYGNKTWTEGLMEYYMHAIHSYTSEGDWHKV